MNSSSDASRAVAAALRPLPSSRAISPKNSPDPRTFSVNSLPSDGVHGEGDAARQHAVESVAGRILLKQDFTGQHAPATRSHQELVDVRRRQRREEWMEAKQVLWCHLELASRQRSREKDGQRTKAADHALPVGSLTPQGNLNKSCIRVLKRYCVRPQCLILLPAAPNQFGCDLLRQSLPAHVSSCTATTLKQDRRGMRS